MTKEDLINALGLEIEAGMNDMFETTSIRDLVEAYIIKAYTQAREDYWPSYGDWRRYGEKKGYVRKVEL